MWIIDVILSLMAILGILMMRWKISDLVLWPNLIFMMLGEGQVPSFKKSPIL